MASPVEFDREKVILEAMLQFWRLGYLKTSVRDLTAATQLKTGVSMEPSRTSTDCFCVPWISMPTS